MSRDIERELLRALPQVDEVLRDVAELDAVGAEVARWIVRREIDAARERALRGAEPGDVRAAVREAAEALGARRLRRVVNATGVVLHTNLGRAPLSDDAREAIAEVAGAATLEFDLRTGERGERAPGAAILAAALCGAERALVVNNNAAALLLALGALARGREVIVSRGEMIEIGGEFRLPEVMEASGAILREVGTTNRTHARDYRRAIGPRTGLILKVHPSNYRVEGFTSAPALGDLVAIAREAAVPLLYDTGSGLLAASPDAPEEPAARDALESGCDLVCFSGDKLLGGPQAGILAGRANLVEACRRSPIARAVRADKLTLAAMEATLWAHATGRETDLPAHRMLTTPTEEIGARASIVATALPAGAGVSLADGESVTGGGSLPGRGMPTMVVAIRHPRPDALAAALRANDPPVIARVERGAVIVDLRTVPPDDDATVIAALTKALG